MSSPTSGERLSALRIPPFCGAGRAPPSARSVSGFFPVGWRRRPLATLFLDEPLMISPPYNPVRTAHNSGNSRIAVARVR